MSENNGYLPLPKSFATTAIHAAQEPEQWSNNEVVTPIVMSTVYKQDEPGEFKPYLYTRFGNPTRAVLEKVIAKLECAKHAACLSSGMGAITTLLGLLEHGDHIVCLDVVYGGTYVLLLQVAKKFGIEVTFAEGDVASFQNQIKLNTKLIYIESPTNPTLKLCDIAEISKMAKQHKVLVAVDNTFLTPYFQRPVVLGADIVVHSLTKYMNGHSDVCMGALVTNDDDLGRKIYFLQKSMGAVPSPFDCYQVLRGLKTLSLRMKQHSKSSLAIAKHLEGHPKVKKVLHPGLPNHPQHELAKKQSSGHSGIFSIYIDGNMDTSKRFLKSLKCFTTAGSLGDCESLISIPTLISHSSWPRDEREKLGITDNLIRLSVGLEDTEDLIADLEQALDSV